MLQRKTVVQFKQRDCPQKKIGPSDSKYGVSLFIKKYYFIINIMTRINDGIINIWVNIFFSVLSHASCFMVFFVGPHIFSHMGNRLSIRMKSSKQYNCTNIRGSLNKFPDFFRVGTFIDSKHMKL